MYHDFMSSLSIFLCVDPIFRSSSLHLTSECFARLTYVSYQRALAGLILAMNEKWELDLRENHYTEIDAINRAVAANTSLLISLNALSLINDESSNLKYLIQRNG